MHPRAAPADAAELEFGSQPFWLGSRRGAVYPFDVCYDRPAGLGWPGFQGRVMV